MPAIGHTELRRLDMTLLLVFDGLLRERKATVVAERLGVTQSSISHALKRLRDIFGEELFLRRPNGVEPTAHALALAPTIRRILELTREALGADPGFDPATAQGTLRIGGLDYHCALLAAPLLARMRHVAPGLTVSFRAAARRDALRALAADELDLALGYFWALPEEFGQETLFEENYAVVGRAGHPALRRLTLPRFLAAEHLLVSQDGALHGVVDRALAERGAARRVVAAVPHFLPALATVADSDLLATLPARLVRSQARRFRLASAKPPLPLRSFTVSAVWHRRQARSALREWLLARVREALRDAARA
jgi:DNA-binding transcriptional LysR family regulator